MTRPSGGQWIGVARCVGRPATGRRIPTTGSASSSQTAANHTSTVPIDRMWGQLAAWAPRGARTGSSAREGGRWLGSLAIPRPFRVHFSWPYLAAPGPLWRLSCTRNAIFIYVLVAHGRIRFPFPASHFPLFHQGFPFSRANSGPIPHPKPAAAAENAHRWIRPEPRCLRG